MIQYSWSTPTNNVNTTRTANSQTTNTSLHVTNQTTQHNQRGSPEMMELVALHHGGHLSIPHRAPLRGGFESWPMPGAASPVMDAAAVNTRGAPQHYQRSRQCQAQPAHHMTSLQQDRHLICLARPKNWPEWPPKGVVLAPQRTLRKGNHLQTRPKVVRHHLADATPQPRGKMGTRRWTEQEATKGLEDDVPREIVEHRLHRRPFEWSGPGFHQKTTRNGRRSMMTPPGRRTTHVGIVIINAGKPSEPFSRISPIHHPFFGVQPLSQLHRPEREEAARHPPLSWPLRWWSSFCRVVAAMDARCWRPRSSAWVNSAASHQAKIRPSLQRLGGSGYLSHRSTAPRPGTPSTVGTSQRPRDRHLPTTKEGEPPPNEARRTRRHRQRSSGGTQGRISPRFGREKKGEEGRREASALPPPS
jgi:hypothetical protein